MGEIGSTANAADTDNKQHTVKIVLDNLFFIVIYPDKISFQSLL